MIEYLLIFIGLLVNLITILIIVKVALPKKEPMDTSNRINHIRLIWWAINDPEKFVDQCPWLAKDEGDNLK